MDLTGLVAGTQFRGQFESRMKSLIEEQGEAEIVCRFCGTRHLFEKEELQGMLDEMNKQRFRELAESLNNPVDLQAMAAAKKAAEEEKGE